MNPEQTAHARRDEPGLPARQHRGGAYRRAALRGVQLVQSCDMWELAEPSVGIEPTTCSLRGAFAVSADGSRHLLPSDLEQRPGGHAGASSPSGDSTETEATLWVPCPGSGAIQAVVLVHEPVRRWSFVRSGHVDPYVDPHTARRDVRASVR